MCTVKNLAIIFLLFLGFFTGKPAEASSVYVMTLNKISLADAHQGVREFMFAKNFALHQEQPHLLIFTKAFPNATGSGRRHVRFSFMTRSDGTRVLVTGAINQIAPLLKEIKHRIDGTPRHEIRNEARNQLPGPINRSPLTLGLAIQERSPDGYVMITDIWEISWAEDVGLKVGDVVLEVNGTPTLKNSPWWIQEQLRGWYSINRPFTLKIRRNEKKGIVRFVPTNPFSRQNERSQTL